MGSAVTDGKNLERRNCDTNSSHRIVFCEATVVALGGGECRRRWPKTEERLVQSQSRVGRSKRKQLRTHQINF